MRTISFYSYKGGVGRSLALANVAKYLSLLQQKVVVVDFDLEAPGLHYKFRDESGQVVQTKGVVDLLSSFVCNEAPPKSLVSYTAVVSGRTPDSPKIRLMPAGRCPDAEYWRMLSRLDWHELFYSQTAPGVGFFLSLQQRIKDEFSPDFLLIDARTGITEIGGVATAILADSVVCFMAHNRENLDGARAVLRGILQTKRVDGADIDLVPVLVRIPPNTSPTKEKKIVDAVAGFLSEPAEELEYTVSVDEVFVLHSDPPLQIEEVIRIDQGREAGDTPLLRDYLKLFGRLVPEKLVASSIRPLLNTLKERAWDDPDGAEQDAANLAFLYPLPATLEALVRFYRLRRVKGERLMQAAERYVDITGNASEPLVWSVVVENNEVVSGWKRQPWSASFVKGVFDAQGEEVRQTAAWVEVGLNLAEFLSGREQRGDAKAVLIAVAENGRISATQAVRAIKLLADFGEADRAIQIASAFREQKINDEDFTEAIGAAILASGDSSLAAELLDSDDFHEEQLRISSPEQWFRIRIQAGRTDGVEEVLRDSLQSVLESQSRRGVGGISTQRLLEIGKLYQQLGSRETFFGEVRKALASHPRFLRDPDEVDGYLRRLARNL